jgi:colanic acid/amylovoran biosynthesis glycosyltransferase
VKDTERPRVLVLATRVPARSGDGTPSFVLDNATALSEEFDITILAPRVRGSRSLEQHDGVTVRRFAYFPSRWERLADDAIMPQLGTSRTLWFQALPLAAMMLLQTLRESRARPPDVVHANWVLPAGLVALIVSILRGVPFLVTSHGADAFRLNGGLLRILNRAVLARSTRFIGVSTDIVEQFGALPVPTEVQPVAADFSLWQRLVPSRSPVQGRVLFVGRLAAKKGVADAIRAVEQLDDVQLRIIGDGPLEGELRALAGSSVVSDRVVFLGRLDRQQIAEEMHTAACLIIPSITAVDGDRDGTPSVLGEAIAAGVPVVASRLAGLSEFIDDGETGLLHEPGDVESIAAALRSMTGSSTMAAQMAQEARLRFAATFDIPQVGRRYGLWYREAMSPAEERST